MSKQTKQAGERTHEVGTQKYIGCLESNLRELTKPMSWQDAAAWAQSPLTKGAYPEGVVLIPADAALAEQRAFYAKQERNKRRNQRRREREAVLRSCGLVKVRGNLGGIYWE